MLTSGSPRLVRLLALFACTSCSLAFTCVQQDDVCTFLGELYAATGGGTWNSTARATAPSSLERFRAGKWASLRHGPRTGWLDAAADVPGGVDYCTFAGVTCTIGTATTTTTANWTNIWTSEDSSTATYYEGYESWNLNGWSATEHIMSQVVMELRLPFANMTGTLPSYGWANLSSLLRLDLRRNFLTGPLPDWSALTNLRSIDLHNNSISGSIPASIGNLSMLDNLQMSYNNFSGSLPENLYQLSGLTWLYLEANQLSGTISSSASHLSNLRILNLARNQLTGVIPSLPTPLYALLLNNNALSGSIPATLCDLAFHPPSGSEGESLGVEAYLRLQFNNLTGAIPPCLFSLLDKFWYFEVNNNNLQYSLPDFTVLSAGSLSHLDLSFNQFTGTIPNSISNVRSAIVYLNNNNFTGPLPPSIASMAALTDLRVHYNQLSGALPDLSALARLKYLYLQQNQFSGSLPCFVSTLAALESLQLYSNQFSGSIPDCWNSWPSIWSPEVLGCHPSGMVWGITALNLFSNQLSGTIPDVFGQLGALQPGLWDLNLGSNNFSGTLPLSLANVRYMSISGNKLNGSISADFTTAAYRMRSLNLGNNLFTGTFPPPNNLYLLQTLILTGNNLSGTLPPDIQQSGFLSTCELSNGKNNNFSCPLPQLPDSCGNMVCSCPAGQFFNKSIGYGDCQACPAGATSEYASMSCTPCPKGSYTLDELTCLPCPADSFSGLGSTRCICNAPFIDTTGGSSSSPICAPCAAGTFFQNGICTDCASGSFSAEGATSCTKCPPPTYTINRLNCTTCPVNAIPVAINENTTECACNFGFYDTLFGLTDSPVCAACPDNGVCTSGYIAAAEGYWRASSNSDQLYRCREGRCEAENVPGPLYYLGAAHNTTNSNSPGRKLFSSMSLALVAVPSSNCKEGTTGPACALCKNSDGSELNETIYAVQSGVCAPCDASAMWSAWTDGDKAALLACSIVFGLAVITFAFLVPLLPALDKRVMAMTEWVKAKVATTRKRVFGERSNHGDEAASVASSEGDEHAHHVDVEHSDNLQVHTHDKKHVAADVDLANAKASGDSHDLETSGSRVDALHVLAQDACARAPADAAVSSVPSARLLSSTRRMTKRLAVASMRLAMNTMKIQYDTTDQDQERSFPQVESLMYMLEDIGSMVQRVGKIVTGFYQIVATFLHSLDVPWPRVFTTVMARVSVVNLNLVQLPKTACLHPNPSYYSQFNGYTLGLLFFILLLATVRLLGSRGLARLLPPAECVERVERFEHRLLVALLLVLFFVYPGVSVAIFGIFSCTELGSGVWYLDSDVRIVCYTPKHWGYLAAGVIWTFVYTVGIPCFFLWLLHHFRVPELAHELADNAWLRELIKLAWLEGMTQETDKHYHVSHTTVSVSNAHLEALHAFFLRGVSPEHADAIMAGEREPLPDADIEAPPPPSLIYRLFSSPWLRLQAYWLDTKAVPPAEKRRAAVLSRLMEWARASEVIAVPIMVWEEGDEEEPEAAKELSKTRSLERKGSKVQASETQMKQRETALHKVGFLFSAYKPEFYYWEEVELGRKLALTSILALITPGTAGQVVVGLLLSLFMLLLNSYCKPYASDLMNSVNIYAHLNLTLYLLVALLLKVNLDQRGNAYFFTGIVSFLAIVPITLPVVLTLYAAMQGMSAGKVFEDAAWD